MIQNFTTNRARTLPQAHEICSFFDPYVGRDAGYLQVTRLSGAGPALVVVPEPGTKTPFEAFRPLNDASRRGQTFEGAFEWTVAQPGATRRTSGRTWSSGTRRRRSTLKPGETRALRTAVSRLGRDSPHREDAGRQRSTRRRRHSRLHRADGHRGEAVPHAGQAQGHERRDRARRRADGDAGSAPRRPASLQYVVRGKHVGPRAADRQLRRRHARRRFTTT